MAKTLKKKETKAPPAPKPFIVAKEEYVDGKFRYTWITVGGIVPTFESPGFLLLEAYPSLYFCDKLLALGDIKLMSYTPDRCALTGRPRVKKRAAKVWVSKKLGEDKDWEARTTWVKANDLTEHMTYLLEYKGRWQVSSPGQLGGWGCYSLRESLMHYMFYVGQCDARKWMRQAVGIYEPLEVKSPSF
jgi:hypothetical protein